MAAATAAISQDKDGSFSAAERTRNKAVRDMTAKWFSDRGMKPTDSHANFMFVNIGTPAKAFREACRAKGDMSELVAKIPVNVIRARDTGLVGAAVAAQELLEASEK